MEPKVGINVTFETLFELLRLEKKRGELQELPKCFLEDVCSYFAQKKQYLAQADSEEARKQLESAHHIIEELFQVRERKILELARLRAKPGNGFVDELSFLEVEKEFYHAIIERVRDLRTKLMTERKAPAPKSKPVEKDTKEIVFLFSVGAFVGKNLETFGPYGSGQKAELPNQIADLLISKGRARQV